MLSNLHPFQGLDLHKDERMTAKSIKLGNDDEDISSTSKRAIFQCSPWRKKGRKVHFLHEESTLGFTMKSPVTQPPQPRSSHHHSLSFSHRSRSPSRPLLLAFPGAFSRQTKRLNGPPNNPSAWTRLLPPRMHTCEASRGRGS